MDWVPVSTGACAEQQGGLSGQVRQSLVPVRAGLGGEGWASETADPGQSDRNKTWIQKWEDEAGPTHTWAPSLTWPITVRAKHFISQTESTLRGFVSLSIVPRIQ